MFYSVSLFSQAPLARGSCALPSVLLYHGIEGSSVITVPDPRESAVIPDVTTILYHSYNTMRIANWFPGNKEKSSAGMLSYPEKFSREINHFYHMAISKATML